MKKQNSLALALCAAMLLTGCDISLGGSTNVEKLLRAPQLSGQSSLVQKALNSYLGESAQLKYPTSGDFLTPFLFGDWNGDGTMDAAVLYTCDAKGQNVFLAVLETGADGWQVTQEVEGLSTEVQTVSFAAMQNSSASQILIGYGSAQGDAYLAVYAYDNRTLETVLQQPYSQMQLADITNSNSQDLILVLPEEENGAVELLMLTNEDGAFRHTQQLAVGEGVYTGCAALSAGTGQDGMPYLVLDGYTGGTGSYLASTILVYDADAGELREYLPDDLYTLYDSTLRYNTALLSRDMDENGTVDIPVELDDGGTIAVTLDRRLNFLLWQDFTGPEGGNSTFGVLDTAYNYFIALPQELRGQLLLDETVNGWTVGNIEGDTTYFTVWLAPLGAGASSNTVRAATIGNQQILIRMETETEIPGLSLAALRDGTIVL